MKRENSIKKAIAVWTISLAIVMVLSCVFAICLEKANIIKYKENAIDTYISATASTDGSLETPTIIYNAVYDGTEKNVEDY